MYDARLSQEVLSCCLSSVSPSESFTTVRTYVRFVCESDHRIPLGGGDLPRNRLVDWISHGSVKPTATPPVIGKENVAQARKRSNKRPIWGRLGSFRPVKKARIDAVLAERGMFPSRTAAAGAVRAGEVRVGADG